MKIPGIVGGPNTAAVNPRMNAIRGGIRPVRHFSTLLLPMAIVFAFGGIFYTFSWNNERQQAGGVCVDCVRQKEMMEEVYFNKKPDSKSYRL